ncbi:unnamed protein product [Didymodactylos carnosus]|uniref:Fatty acid desaturase domain-containing protein n=1 Tax=Didymodactylos carnosus TaxID=1234261 RepID=A0A815IGW0_9BILA|nr:unnamed protein product [Didymodactylos carnosus]CAF1368161.1 unnamed protein product [Didymodactylos carnosus]CAF3999620.1 unnamed protein product [Didymodactylos carnosus]CAF4252088.1 unnamed protein product [Didymodactylos carnosus]
MAQSVNESPNEILKHWNRNYPVAAKLDNELESESKKSHTRYIPPSSNVNGICIALTIFLLWCFFWYHAVFQINLSKTHKSNRSHWFDVIFTFVILEFLYTGLFITCHDAMHGCIVYRYQKLNNLIGYVCFTMYAWLDYNRMYVKHWQHHNHAGLVGKDPDFHDGRFISLPVWYAKFMYEYSSIKQIVKVLLWTQFLIHVLHVETINVVVYMAICPLLSSFRLFYFGTYLPHKPNEDASEIMNWEKTRTSKANRLISFLCCYHFDYHWEHHRWPYAP